VLAAVACISVASTVAVRADDAAMPTGYKGDMMMQMKDAQDKLEQLAAAMPEAKYSWRPAKDVRSVGEVFLHVAQANFGIPGFMGVTPPEGFKFDGYDKSMTKKADIQKALHDSFDHMEKAFMGASDADMEKSIELFGHKMTERGGYMILLSHAHEHLGQSIAYARSNGVAPPWTAKQQEAEKKTVEHMGDKK
jgi:uncharacterized damage-inducible protein DinB